MENKRNAYEQIITVDEHGCVISVKFIYNGQEVMSTIKRKEKEES